MNFSVNDYIVLAAYAAVILFIGLWVSRTKKGHEKTAEDYFLASKSLPWWAIGASLIAANISAEQIIGMSGQGFGLGLAIASYEWMAALTLIIVGKFFLPIFIKKNLYTIPDFIKHRYSVELKSILAIFWIALFTFVNLTTVLLLGASAMDMIIGNGNGDYFLYCIIGLAVFSAAYSLWGGLSAVAWTDVVQVALLVIGGLITTWIALDHVTAEGGVVNGFNHILEAAPDKFHMILSKDHPLYNELPGIAVLVGGMWIANLYYWGFNQYIIQRALAAKSLKEAQKGIVFAGFLKLIVPLIVVVPGIIAFVMYSQPEGTTIIAGVNDSLAVDQLYQANDQAYPWLVRTFVPEGIKGLILAALAAAIVSSLASMMNSISTIFTMDIYKQHINKNAGEGKTVTIGRISAAVALVIAMILAPLLSSERGIFNIIQEYTGMVSPGILAIFMLGLFWKKATNRAAIFGAILSIVIAFLFKLGTLPWMDQMGLTFLATVAIMVIISLIEHKGKNDDKGISFEKGMFKTGAAFNISAFAILIILVVLYTVFW
ncbi:MAG: sodium/glucose cotransporter [Bacteroidetes bacterium GWF2_38_335]|nr:MAG: sodium/glucose cotransporter [Bacteroidetes bacterium GWF2_38_335]OFY80624.1 MAG: sodium/glucose cotransporter [Bacteroidetes bacterium RIFOXYA12_FULL_38_20]HBS86964.1 sodium/glucose cotransporter [Bacteroidales bacterium]